jgi:RHS repeat-associated protein
MPQLIGRLIRLVLWTLIGFFRRRRTLAANAANAASARSGPRGSSTTSSLLAIVAVVGVLTVTAWSRVAARLAPAFAFTGTGVQQDPPDCQPCMAGPVPPQSDPGPCIGPEGGPDWPPSEPTNPGAPGGPGGPATIGPDSPNAICVITEPAPPLVNVVTPGVFTDATSTESVLAGDPTPIGGVLAAHTKSATDPTPASMDPANAARLGLGQFAQFFRGSVDAATRALRWADVDFTIPGVTPDSTLVIGRRYVSDLNYDGVGSPGQDWVSSLYDRVFVVNSTTLRHVDWTSPYNDATFYFNYVDSGTGADCPICGPAPAAKFYAGSPVNGDLIEAHGSPTTNHYILHHRDGSWRDFDSVGRVIRRQDKHGNRITYTYTSGKLSSVVDSVGRKFVVTTDAGGRITKIEFQDPNTLAKTRLVTYVNSSGKLTQVTHSTRTVASWDASWNYSETTRAPSTSYVYNLGGFLTEVHNDAGDLTMSLSYDGPHSGKVASQTTYPDPNDSTTWGNWQYSRSGNTTTIVDPRNYKTEYDVAAGTNQVVTIRRFIVNLGTIHPSRPLTVGQPTFYTYQLDRDTACNCGGPVKKFTLPGGGAFQLTWDGDHNVTELDELPRPNSGQPTLVHTWTYDSQDRMTSYVPPIGNASGNPSLYTTTITWTNDPQNAGWVQEDVSIPPRNGRTVATVWTYKRDDKGRLRESWSPDQGSGQRTYTKWTYYPDADLYMARMPQKRECGASLAMWQTYVWDVLGNLASANSSRGPSGAYINFQESFDLEGRRIQWLGPDRGGYRYEHRWRYDADGRLTYLAYRNLDDQGQIQNSHEWIVWGFKHDGSDRLTTERHEVDVVSGQSVWALTQHTYDEGGLEIQTTDPDGVTSRTDYDERELPWNVYSAYGSTVQHSESYSYIDDGLVQVDQAPTENGAHTPVTYVYDAYDRLSQIVLADGSYSQLAYDPEGRHTSVSLFAPVGGVMREVRRNELTYDDWHYQPTEIRRIVKDELALNTLRIVANQAYYTPAGAIQRIALNSQNFTTFQYDEFGRLSNALDTLGNQEQLQYNAYSGWLTTRTLVHVDPNTGLPTTVTESITTDEVGRVTAQSMAGGGLTSTVSLTYDSVDNVLRSTDADGFASVLSYRLDGLLTRAEDWIDSTGSQKRVHLQQWTAGARRSRLVDDRGAPVDYLYNALGWPMQEVTGDGRMWQYAYTDGGELKTVTDPQGIRIVNSYSTLSKPTGRTVYDSANNVLETDAYTWTAAGNAKQVTRTPTGGASTYVQFGRDSEGNALWENQDGLVVNYDRNALGLVSRVTGPSGLWRSFDYDVNLRPTTIRDETNAVVATNQWLGASRALLSRQFGNGTQLLVGRDGLTRVNSIRHEIASSHALIAQTTNGLTSGGLVGYETFAHRQNKGNVFRYDGLGRVTDAKMGSSNPAAEWANPGTTSFDLDEQFSIGAEDHRLQVTQVPSSGPPSVTSYVTDPLREYYTQIGGVARTYTENGNLRTIANRTFTYDWADHLVDVHDGANGVATYTYDALGRRQTKTVSGVVTRYVYAGAWLLEEYVNGTLEAVHDYADGADELVRTRRVDHADVNNNGNTTELVSLYAHTDRLGSVTHLTNSAGTVVESYAYSAYGKPTIYDKNGNVVASSPTNSSRMFTARELDAETGLYYYRARHYEPDTGTFLQEDPLRFDGGIDLFEYAASSPTNLSDPSGMAFESIKAAANAVLGALKDAASSGALAEMALSSIPILSDILDLLSAMTGYDVTHYIATGDLKSLGCWDRIKMAAWAAADLAGSAVGAGIANKLEKLLKWLKELKGGKAAAAAAEDAAKAAKCLGNGCFVLGTAVCTAIGLVPIEDVAPGEQVVTSSVSSTGSVSTDRGCQVECTTRSTVEVVMTVVVRAVDGSEDVLLGTPSHLVYRETSRSWVALGDVRVGERLNGSNGPILVVGRDVVVGTCPVANLVVNDAHTYRVGRLGVLVHNGCPTNLREQLAIEEAVSNKGGKVIMSKLDDPKYADCVKKQFMHESPAGNINVHYNVNTKTGEISGAKIKTD